MSTDATPVASSATPEPAPVPAIDQAVISGDVAAFREAKRAERSGKPLEPATPADPPPAEPVEQAASTEVTPDPASETGKPRKNADTRVKELLAERHLITERAERAERELAELRRRQPQPVDAPPAAPSPAPVADQSFPDYDTYLQTHPDTPYEKYMGLVAAHEARQAVKAALAEHEAEARANSEQQTRSKAIQERDAKFKSVMDTAIAADPEFLDGLSEDVKALKPFSAIRDDKGRWTERPTGYHAIADEVLSSDVAPQLMRHFTDHPEDLHRIATLPPGPLHKEIGKLELRLSAAPAAPPPKTVTSAPPPPTTLGRQPTLPANAADAAVSTGDVAAYRAARLRERVAQFTR